MEIKYIHFEFFQKIFTVQNAKNNKNQQQAHTKTESTKKKLLPSFPLGNETGSSTASFLREHDAVCESGEARFRCDPLVVVCDLSVNTWFVLLGAAVAPAHHAVQKHPP